MIKTSMTLIFILIFLLAIFTFAFMVLFQEAKIGVTVATSYWKSFRAMWDELIP
jgi:SNF family Na+-dependent transporter